MNVIQKKNFVKSVKKTTIQITTVDVHTPKDVKFHIWENVFNAWKDLF